MATRALSADARSASLEIAPNFPPVTRRAFAGMAAIAGVVAATPVARAAPPPAPTRPWDVLIARYEALLAEEDRFDRDIYKPASDRLSAQLDPMPPSYFDHVARNGHVARYALYHGEDGLPWGPAFDRAREMAREFAAWREQADKVHSQPWWRRVEEQCDRMNSAIWEVEEAILLAPAPDAVALARKVRIFFERRLSEVGAEVEAVMKADAERLS